MPKEKMPVIDDWRARAAEADALLVKWGAHEIKGLDPKRAEAIGLKPAVRRVGYGSLSQELPAMFTHEGTIARYCRRTAELMLESSEYWQQIEVNTRETNQYYKEILTTSRVQEEAYRTAADILSKIMARPSLLNVWETSCPGLLRSKERELQLQEEGTHVYLQTLKEHTRVSLVYDAVVALKKIEQERPIRPADIAERHQAVAARAQVEMDKIIEQEAALARELHEIGDGSETIASYSAPLLACLETNVLSMRGQRLLAAPTELFQLAHLELLDLAHNRLTELPREVERLAGLKKLYLDHNELRRLPHELYKLSNSLTLLGVADNPLEHELLQLYYAGLPVLLAHLKATRPRRAYDAASASSRSLANDVGNFDLFTGELPRYSPPVS